MTPRTDQGRSKLDPRVRRRLKQIARAPIDYVWDWHLKQHIAPWRFARRVWELGWALRGVLGGILTLAASAAVVGHFELFQSAQAPVLRLLFLALCALVFGTAAGAAVGWGIWGLALLAPWLAYFAMASTTKLAETPARILIVLPVWTLLVVGWRLCLAERKRLWAVVLWLALSIGAGLLTSGLVGFRSALGLDWPRGGTLFGLLLAGLGGLAWRWIGHRWKNAPTFGQVSCLVGGVMAGVLAVSASYDLASTVSWVGNQFPQLDFLVTLFWFWSGGGFAIGLFKTVQWTTRKAIRVGLSRVLVTGAPLGWVIAALVEYFGAVAPESGFGPARASLEWRLAARSHFVLTLLLLAIHLIGYWRGRVTARRILDLNSIWVVSFAALLAVTTKLGAFAQLGARQAMTGVAIAAAMIGVLMMIARAERDWSSLSGRSVFLYVAWGGAFIAILFADQLNPTWKLDQHMAVQVFEGMLTLGLPLAIQGRLAARTKTSCRVPVLTHLTLIVAGMLVAFALMHINYTDWRWLSAAIPAWFMVLGAARVFYPSWDRLAGAMAGTMLAAGTTLYWRLPATLCIPFQPALPSAQTLNEWYRARAALSLEGQLSITLAGMMVGALAGWLVFKGKRSIPPASPAVRPCAPDT